MASLSLLGTLVVAPAATRTWMGSVSTDFYDSANWSPNGVPASGDTLNITNGSISISPGFVSSGQIQWTGGTLYGALVISTGATMAISGQETKHLWCNLTNAGTITLSSPLEFDNYDRQLMNAAGALFDVQGDVGISGGWSGQQFLNAGTFRKSGGTNTLTLSAVTFANSGLLDIQSGTLTVDTALAMNGGSIHCILLTTDHSSLSGTLVGGVNWTNGTMYGGFAVATNGTFAVSGPDTKYLNCNLTNAGTITLSSPLGLIDYDRQLRNLAGALFDVQADVGISGGWGGQQIANAGTFRKSGGTATCAIDRYIAFLNNGTLLVQSGGMDLQGGGTLTGACTANPGTAITFSGGALSLDPHAVFSGGGFIGIAGGGPSLSGTMATRMSWTAGTIYGGWSIAPNGLLAVSGPDAKNLNCNLTNAGMITLSGPLGFVDYDRLLVNLAGALFDVQADVGINGGWAGQQIVNAGTFRKSGGTNICAIDSHIAFQNGGAIQAQNGTIQLNGGGALTGSCSASNDSTILFNNGLFVVAPAAAFSGNGFVGVVNGGTPAFIGTLATSMKWTGGTIYGGWSIAANGLLVASGPDTKNLNCNLTNAGTIALSGPLSFVDYDRLLVNLGGAILDVQTDVGINGGWNGQQIVNAGTFRKSGGTNTCAIESHVAFQNSGAIQAQNGTIQLNGGGALAGSCSAFGGANIQFSNGAFVVDPAASFSGNGFVGVVSGGTPTFIGTLATSMKWTGGAIYGGWSIAANGLLVASGPDTKEMWGNLTNAGSIHLSGPLKFCDNNRLLVNSAGALFEVQADVGISGGWSGQQFLNAGTFRKSGGTNTLILSAVTFANSGLLDIQSGTLTLDTALAMNGGSIHCILLTTDHSSLSGALVGMVNWTNGTMYGGFAVATNGTLAISGPDTKYLNCNLTNAGTISLSSPLGFIDYERQLRNLAGALFDVQVDVGISGGWNGQQIVNAGTFRKSAGTNTCSISSYIAFQNSGTVESQRGLLSFDAGFANAAGSLVVRLNSVADWGRIAWTGPLTLNGPFSVSLLSGYTPGLSNTFQVLTYPSVTGPFTSYSGLELGGGLKLTPTLGPTAFSLTVQTSSVSPPLISSHPVSQTVSAGTDVTFSVTASGTPPLSYVWRLNGSNLANATNATLTLTNVQPNQAGNYAVMVTNVAGSVLSSNAVLTVNSTPTNCAAAPGSMVSWWTGNGNAEDSVGPNFGIMAGATSFAPGKVGQAFSFDGVSGWVDIPLPTSLDPTGPFSVEAWIKANPQQPNGVFLIVDKSHGFTDYTGWGLQGNADGTFAFFFGTGGSFPQVNSVGSVLDDQWHHVAGVFTGTQLQIFMDGTMQGSAAQTALPASNSRPVEIGHSWGGGTPTRYYRGLIDEISYYSRGLSSNEVAAIYAAGSAGKCSAVTPSISTQPVSQTVSAGTNVTFSVTATGTTPLSYLWRFNGSNLASATSATLTLTNVQPNQAGSYAVLITNVAGSVLSSNAILTVNSTPTNCTAAPAGMVSWWTGNGSGEDSVGPNNGIVAATATFAPGKVGQAFSFDGVKGWVDIPNPTSLDPTGPFSVEVWIKANAQQTSPDGQFLIVDKSHGFADGTGWGLQGNGNGTVGFLFGIGGGGDAGYFPKVNTIASVLDDQWHHLAGVFTGTQLQIYLDGTLQGSLAQTVLPANNTRPVEIGRSWGGGTPTRYFRGLIDEVSYYNRGLSSNEVAAIYAAGSAGKCSVPIQTGLRADYLFQNSLVSSVGNPPALSNLGNNAFVTATVEGAAQTVLAFGFNDGLLLQPGTSVIPSNVFSVVILAELDDVSYYRRLLGFPAVATDEGWYVHNGRLSYWPVVDGSSEAVEAGQFAQFVMTRAADGTVRGYVDGVLQAEFLDTDGSAGPGANGVLRFFRDNATEASAGQVARIRVYDVALTDAQVAALDRLPPAGPVLVLTRAGDAVTVSWSTNYAGYRLRSGPSLTPPISWNTVSNVTVSGPVFQATVNATNNSGFFQLVKP